jgi:hypothetical protein
LDTVNCKRLLCSSCHLNPYNVNDTAEKSDSSL